MKELWEGYNGVLARTVLAQIHKSLLTYVSRGQPSLYVSVQELGKPGRG
jgi:hypothetical protein